MHRLEVSGVVRHIYKSLGVKGLTLSPYIIVGGRQYLRRARICSVTTAYHVVSYYLLKVKWEVQLISPCDWAAVRGGLTHSPFPVWVLSGFNASVNRPVACNESQCQDLFPVTHNVVQVNISYLVMCTSPWHQYSHLSTEHSISNFDILLTVCLIIFILILTNLMH